MEIKPIFESRDTLSVEEKEQLLAFFAEELFYRLEPGKLTSYYLNGEDGVAGLEEVMSHPNDNEATYGLLRSADELKGNPSQKLIGKLLRPILRGSLRERI